MKICEYCGEEFEPKHTTPWQRFCCYNHKTYAARIANPTRTKEIGRRSKHNIKMEVLRAYGGRCVACGETDPDMLCIDHVNNDGTRQRMEAGISASGEPMYGWLKKNGYPAGFQVLCANHNTKKLVRGGLMPEIKPLELGVLI